MQVHLETTIIINIAKRFLEKQARTGLSYHLLLHPYVGIRQVEKRMKLSDIIADVYLF